MSYRQVAFRSFWVAVWLLLIVSMARQQGQFVPAVIVVLIVGLLFGVIAATTASDFVINHRRLCLAAGIALAVGSSGALIAVIYNAEPSPLIVATMAVLIILGVLAALLPHLLDTYRQAKARQRPAPPAVSFAGVRECVSAFRFVIGAWNQFFRLGSFWIVVCWAVPWVSYDMMVRHWMWLKQLEHDGKPIGPPFAPPAGLVLAAVTITCAIIAIPSFAVTWHRYVAGVKCVFNLRVLLRSRRSLRYLWRLAVGLWMFGFFARLADLNIPGVEAIGSPLIELAVGASVYVAVLLFALWVGSEWLLIFPAVAISNRHFTATELVPLAKSLGRGLRSGAALTLLPCHFAYQAALFAILWILNEEGVVAAQMFSLTASVLLFGMIAFVTTFLSRAYAVVMASPAGLELEARD